MSYKIFKEPNYRSYNLSIKNIELDINFNIKLYKNLKLEKAFKEVEKKYLKYNVKSKLIYNTQLNKLTDKQFNIYNNIYYMDLTKIYKKYFINNKYNIGKGFTNAWRKMYEICEVNKKFIPNTSTVRHFDICGSPGAFILAVNHFIKTKRKHQDYDWYIQSYTGDYGLTDSFNLYKNYPDRFLEGPDKGDITSSKTIIFYRDYFKDNKLNIVTSDCGLSPSEVWASKDSKLTREIQMLKIFYGQFVSAISVLDKNGNLFMKSYSTFTPFSISLIYFMCCVFDKVKLVKPESSRYPEGNEIYYLCENFRGITDIVFYKLINVLENWSDDIHKKSIISFTCMNKELLKNIQDKMSLFYNKRLDDKNYKRQLINTYVGTEEDLLESPNSYLKKLKELENLTDKHTIEVAKRYIRKLKYRRIRQEDKLI